MLPQIIAYLLQYIKYQEKLIVVLLGIVLGKSVARAQYDEPVNKPYRKFQVDDMPIIETLEKLNHKDLLTNYELKHGKPLKPVVRRQNSVVTVPTTLTCPKCSAPSEYLYANNGQRGQYKCKVCSCTFSNRNRFLKEALMKCPHCFKALEQIKARKEFDVFKCRNNACSFYQKNIKNMTSEEKERFKKDPQAFKVRYIFRKFNFDFKPLSKESPVNPP
ncbi:hypothetical protein TMU01_03080 [Tenuibacillus multivorans]|nr:hypothetical protein TMU01_03080 [Tenuibacillus multivorans]